MTGREAASVGGGSIRSDLQDGDHELEADLGRRPISAGAAVRGWT
jgi:hypothetical protein